MKIVKNGFTLTEILLAIAIVGVIAALVLPAIVTNYQNRALDIGFEREIKTISGAVRNLAVSENKVDFYSTMMYTASTQETYEETSGKFVKKYLKVSKYCGDSNGDCFGDKYYNYNDATHKKDIYEPVYKGACASLKNGASICITPQVGGDAISGLLDINGKKGPNILNRDLRHFTIDLKENKTSLSGTTTEVLSTPESDLKPKKNGGSTTPDGPCAESSISKECCDTQTVKKGDPCCIHYKSQVGHPCYEVSEPPKSACEIDPNSLDCCKTKTITNETHPCCLYNEIAKNVNVCRKVTINFECDTKYHRPNLNYRNTCHFKQSGYDDGAYYGIFTILSANTECKKNGLPVDCNDFNNYIGNNNGRFFDKNNSGIKTHPILHKQCQLIRNNTILKTYSWYDECVQGITYTYIPEN